MKKVIVCIFCILLVLHIQAQSFSFAHVTDTHIGSKTSYEDLQKTINDINTLSEIDFVLFTGDITEFGSDIELHEAKEIIDQLNKPWYIVPGNHDSKWSESGCNSFAEIFGAESFCFQNKGFLFIGTASGPNMRMGPGLVPREQMVFLDSILSNMDNTKQPIIFVNHYPLNDALTNSPAVISKLKTRNIQATLLGHGHINKLYNFDGIPGVMGRSNLRAKKDSEGYNIATIKNDTLYYRERIPNKETLPVWCKVPISEKNFKQHNNLSNKTDSINKVYKQVKVTWKLQDNSDIGSGLASNEIYTIYANTIGEIIALSTTTGQVLWKYKSNGKIFSSPAIHKNRVVCPSSDGNIYCLNLTDGKVLWIFTTPKSIVASPVIEKNLVFVGGSDGVFRAIDLKMGALVWSFNNVKNFVECKPVIYKNNIYFGSWGNTFYALNKKSGQLQWKREKYSNRMYSPAAVWPVAARGKIFIVAPDRHMSAIDAKTGKDIWDSGDFSCRESIGISRRGKYVYVKNMFEGNIDAFYTKGNNQKLAWESKAELGYEISPSPITEAGNLIFVPTTAGIVYAINKNTHTVVWKHKVSDAMINHILPVGDNKLVVSAFDGKVTCLLY